MATGKSERVLGDDWAEVMRARGDWVVKLPSSSMAGLPDWLWVRGPSRFVEAKKLQERGSAFVPSQCTRAQRFFLEAVARHGGLSYVLVLGPDSWYMQRVFDHVVAISREVFEAKAEAY